MVRVKALRGGIASLLLITCCGWVAAMDQTEKQACMARLTKLDPDGIVFANPAHGPKLRVLFVTYDSSRAAAACIARRLEMEWEVIGWCQLWHKPGADLIERMLNALQRDYDVMVVGGRIAFRNFPPEVRHALYQKAIAGTGVVVLGHEHPFPREIVAKMQKVPTEAVLPGVPLGAFEGLSKIKDPKQTPEDRLDPFGRFIPAGYAWKDFDKDYARSVKGTTLQKVRVVNLPFRGAGWGVQASLISAPAGGVGSPALRITDEYFMSMLCKAIRWAASKPPAATITRVQPQGEVIAPGAEIKASVDLQAKEALGAAHLVWTVRAGTLEIIRQGQTDVRVDADTTTLPLTLPALGAGCYYVDARLQVKGKIVDWGTGFFRVQGPTRIQALHPSKPGFDPGEAVSGTIQIQDAPPNSQLTLSLVDSWKRVLKRVTVAANNGASPFSLSLDSPANGITFALRAAVMAKGRAQAQATIYVPIRRPDPDFVWNICLAEDNQDWYLARLRRRVLRPYRVDTDNYFAAQRYQALLLGRDGIAAQGRPFLYGGLVNEEKYADFETKLRQTVRALKPTGLLYVNTGDDTHPAMSLPKSFEGEFQAYLKKKHKDLAGLEKAWGIKVEAWDTVNQKFIDAQKQAGNFAPVTDMLMFCEDHFFRGLDRLRAAGREEDPTVRIGQFAVGGFGMGLGAYLQNVDYFAPYYRDAKVEILGAFHGKIPDGYYGSNGGYFGTSGSADLRANEPWYTLLSGGNIVHFWYTPCRLEGDLSVHPLRAGIWWENAAEIKSGIGMQVLRATRRIDPVAILYSRESGYADKYESEISEIANSRENANAIAHDLGLQYRYVSGPQVTAGVLAQTGTRLLILPYCQALRPEEADAIRAFVKAGGTLLADTRPAVWDELCRPLQQGRLDDVFGIKRTPAKKYVVYGELKTTQAVPGLDAQTVIDTATADKTVQATTAKAYAAVGNVPAILVNTFGKGRGVLLNAFMGRFRLRQADGKSLMWTALYRWIFNQAGVEVERIDAQQKGTHAIAVRRVTWTNGTMEILGVRKRGLGSETYPVNVTLTLPQTRHVYGMRDGKYFGHTKSFTDAFRASQTRLYALLPYKVNGLMLELPKQAARGQALQGTVAIKSSGGAPAPHAMLLQVLGQGKTPLGCFEQKLWIENGKGSFALPIAHNETPGTYTVRLKDIPTGVTAEAAFTVAE